MFFLKALYTTCSNVSKLTSENFSLTILDSVEKDFTSTVEKVIKLLIAINEVINKIFMLVYICLNVNRNNHAIPKHFTKINKNTDYQQLKNNT